ncbi:MAG TPA: class I SAM-dependent methyltransferase [Pyrinomonadaceae bacterium]|nr:class I SAM-dependent methyltransferase [Pyrinomonadaceae bacterium]
MHQDEIDMMSINDIELLFWKGRTRPPESTLKSIYVHKSLKFVSALDAAIGEVHPRRMIEVGVLDGGSTIYWQAKYQPECLITFDLNSGAPNLVAYVQRNRLTDSVHSYFGVSQADSDVLRGLVARHLPGQLVDVVIDDASHRFAETRTTLETLLPFVRPGGIYIIEDWAWGHGVNWPLDLWDDRPLLSPLLVEPVLISASGKNVIDSVEINPMFALLRRGTAQLPLDGSFRLTDYYIPRGFSITLNDQLGEPPQL